MEQRSEVVLGFDARERWLSRTALFPASRESAYLLRQDVAKPLSTDVMVWPTVFRDDAVDALGVNAPSLGSSGVPRREWTGAIQGLWSSLSELEAHLSPYSQTLPGPFSIVAITLDERHVADFGADRIEPAAPRALDASWRLLGYDVSDAWLLSGLMNCGYDAHGVEELRRMWSPALNDAHLFRDRETAARFAEESELRVPAHAPFFPFGLWERKAPAPG